jgi:hypothetical protein
MGWEKRRHGRLYYYRYERVRGRRVKRYVGSQATARAAAEHDDLLRRERAAARRAWDAHEGEAAPLSSMTRVCLDSCELLVHALLLLDDLYRHGGQWRRRHGRPALQRPG